jgi:hypothetical protein
MFGLATRAALRRAVGGHAKSRPRPMRQPSRYKLQILKYVISQFRIAADHWYFG